MTLDPTLIWQALAIIAAGFGAGFINVIVGSGTLITFPVLLWFGLPALTANMSSNLGLVAGNFSGVWGYRKEIAANSAIARKLVLASALGGIIGAALLLTLPSSVFDVAVPALIALGVLMVALAPLVQKRTAAKLRAAGSRPNTQQMSRPALTFIIVLLLGIYGGYFGAAQGVLLVGFLGMLLTISLQSLNALKNLLAAVVNVLSAAIFTVFAFNQINWWVVLAIACGAMLGGIAGAKVGRRLPPIVLRVVIIVVGIVALLNMLF